MLLRYGLNLIIGMLSLLICQISILHADVIQSQKHHFNVEVVTGSLQHPWGLAFLPGGGILVTERTGRLRRIEDGSLLPTPIAGLPKIRGKRAGRIAGHRPASRFCAESLALSGLCRRKLG